MADRTLTINHADGGSETYTINRDKFAGVRALTIDGDNVSIYHTAVPKEQAKETTFGGSNNITVNRDVEPLLKDVVGGAAVAYSLRDLNDTMGNNKVVRVRRDSDNVERDFAASEMGKTLEDWLNASVYSSSFSGGLDNWSGLRATVEASQDYLKVTPSTESNTHMASRNGVFTSGRKHLLKFDIKFPTGNTIVTGFRVLEPSGDTLFTINNETQGEYVSYSFEVTSSGVGALRFLARNNSTFTFSGDGEEHFLVRNIEVTDIEGDGFVHTWYDQSGNNKDSIQTDPTKQPKLVSKGRYLGELDFDGTQCFSKINEGVLTSIQDVYVSCVSKRRNGNQGYIAQVSDGANRLFINPRRTTIGTEAVLLAYDNLDDIDTLTTLTAAQGTYNGYKDGVDVNDTETTVSSGAGQFTVGASSTEGAKLNGTIKEIIIYDSDQSANRLAIEANIKSAVENPVDVFIMMGQSNMVGFNVGDWPPTSYLSGANDDKVWISSEAGTALNDQGDLTTAGYDTDGWIKLDEYAAQSRFGYGPNLDFARTLVNDYNYKSLGIIKWARNGTSIELSWKKSVNKFYPSLVSFLNQQISDLRTRVGGAGIRIAGFVWFQGHGDSAVQSRAEAYEANLTQLVADLRADVDSAAAAQIIIARSPDFWKLPFEVGELEENAQRVINVDTIKTAQQNVAENDGNGLWVNTDDYDYREPWVSGVVGNRPVHLTTDAKQALGVRLANAVATQTNYTG
jgi:hypothetical protein